MPLAATAARGTTLDSHRDQPLQRELHPSLPASARHAAPSAASLSVECCAISRRSPARLAGENPETKKVGLPPTACEAARERRAGRAPVRQLVHRRTEDGRHRRLQLQPALCAGCVFIRLYACSAVPRCVAAVPVPGGASFDAFSCAGVSYTYDDCIFLPGHIYFSADDVRSRNDERLAAADEGDLGSVGREAWQAEPARECRRSQRHFFVLFAREACSTRQLALKEAFDGSARECAVLWLCCRNVPQSHDRGVRSRFCVWFH